MNFRFSNEVIDVIREHLRVIQEKIKTVKLDLEEAENMERVLSNFIQYASNGWFLHILDLLEKNQFLFQKLTAEKRYLLEQIEAICIEGEKEAIDIFRRYPAYIEEAFKYVNLPIDLNSRHPRYSIDDGFIRLEIDEKMRIAKISNNEGKIAVIPADVNAVTERMLQEHKRLFGRSFDGKKFLKLLRKNYLAIIKKTHQNDGSSIPIRNITTRLGKNIKGFRTDEFLIDLSLLAQKGPFNIDRRQLDLQQTKNTNQGMLLHGSAGRGYIGFIIFKEI